MHASLQISKPKKTKTKPIWSNQISNKLHIHVSIFLYNNIEKSIFCLVSFDIIETNLMNSKKTRFLMITSYMTNGDSNRYCQKFLKLFDILEHFIEIEKNNYWSYREILSNRIKYIAIACNRSTCFEKLVILEFTQIPKHILLYNLSHITHSVYLHVTYILNTTTEKKINSTLIFSNCSKYSCQTFLLSEIRKTNTKLQCIRN